MDLDDLGQIPPGDVIEADICIVGSGPAGMTIARELAGCSSRILMLESGDREQNPWCDALNTIVSTGAPRVMNQTLVRNRVFGGSSATWAGRAAVFDRLDFAQRDWVPYSGWPISRDAIAPYLPRSAAHLGLAVADNEDTARLWSAIGDSCRPQFDCTLLKDYFWSYSRDPISNDFMRFGPRALREPLAGVRCLLNATVTHIVTNSNGTSVQELEVTGRDKQRRNVHAPLTVLCGGAIENARLLLASNRMMRCGVGNNNDVVGRYLMDHPRGGIGYFAVGDHEIAQSIFNNFRTKINGQNATLNYGVTLSPQLQREEGLLNCSAYVYGHHPAIDDPWNSMRRLALRRSAPGNDLINLARHPVSCIRNVKRFVIDRRDPVQRVESVILQCMVEQQPDPESRITLDEETDALGMRLSRIDWRLHDQEARSVRRIGQLFVAETRRLKLPTPQLVDMVTQPHAQFVFPDIAHPTGTTRMAADPRYGVVDANCAVHGVDGLFVAGSSVFPTSGHANPTQMIVALAARLADHLKHLLRSASKQSVLPSFVPSARPEAANRPSF